MRAVFRSGIDGRWRCRLVSYYVLSTPVYVPVTAPPSTLRTAPVMKTPDPKPEGIRVGDVLGCPITASGVCPPRRSRLVRHRLDHVGRDKPGRDRIHPDILILPQFARPRFVMPITPDLSPRIRLPKFPYRPTTLERFKITPPRRGDHVRRHRARAMNTPLRFTRITASNCSSSSWTPPPILIFDELSVAQDAGVVTST